MTSAWAVGSESVILRFHPRPTIRPSHTTTAPTGTSPASCARWAQRKASSIQSSSEAVLGLGSSVLGPDADVFCGGTEVDAPQYSSGFDAGMQGSTRRFGVEHVGTRSTFGQNSDHTQDRTHDFRYDRVDY